MRLQHIDIAGFKSFAKKSTLSFDTPVTAVVGPNGSGKSNVVEAFRFVLGEQSMKSMRGKVGADLIFRGSNGAARLSRAAVSITFDNSDKVFAFGALQADGDTSKSPVLFDTITFTRELFADGTSKYSMNGTEIRLKQMVELFSSVNIGASSYHIISQGEADSILRASPRDRREMLEEALGLKIYHYRIKESESKLAKSAETLKEVQALRRELAPHLKFLATQVQKIEKGRSIRTELEATLLQYLATERDHLAHEDRRLHDAVSLIERKKHDLEKTLASLPGQGHVEDTHGADIAKAKTLIQSLREKRRALESRIGRLEGMIEVERRMLTERSQAIVDGPAISFAPTEYIQLLADIEYFITSIKGAATLEVVQSAIARIDPILASLKARQPQVAVATPAPQQSNNLKETAQELEDLGRELQTIISQESDAEHVLRSFETKRDEQQRTLQSATTTRYEVLGELTNCNAELSILSVNKASFAERKEYFDADLKEAAFLFGPQFLHTLKDAHGMPELNLHDLKRSIDRLKIRLDEHSGIGNDVVGEYESTVERDAFLAREVADIEGSIRNLESLIIDLKKVLDDKFTTGVTVINERFGEFFKTMFGGGGAFLSITVEKKKKRKSDEDLELGEDMPEEDDDRFLERGIDVHVSLPEKKVKELTMLSGGERSLVSIALLFAISQVNPPPILVLDETDAALDEANSRRYGDMVERLSEYSQLIVVTHNRETMSRASVLYGVTLGADGASKLLSIKFDEAVKVAK